jgi:murein tripeptide amidase MpaA
LDFNHFFTNTELTNLLNEWQAAYPHLLRVTSIGDSHEGKPIWLLTLTNQATGPDTQKPAVWIDANIHATEILGTTSALYIAFHLLAGYATDERITRQLDQSVYYILPRVNPDGAEWAMAANPKFIRSGVRPYPWEQKAEGLHEQDINADGKILQMRIPDPMAIGRSAPWIPV